MGCVSCIIYIHYFTSSYIHLKQFPYTNIANVKNIIKKKCFTNQYLLNRHESTGKDNGGKINRQNDKRVMEVENKMCGRETEKGE